MHITARVDFQLPFQSEKIGASMVKYYTQWFLLRRPIHVRFCPASRSRLCLRKKTALCHDAELSIFSSAGLLSQKNTTMAFVFVSEDSVTIFLIKRTKI